MNLFNSDPSFWISPETSSHFPHGDDILTNLRKEGDDGPSFNSTFVDTVDSQNEVQYFLPDFSTRSNNSSPDPTQSPDAQFNIEDNGDSVLKRKASAEQEQEGPIQKTQHTVTSAPAKKFTSTNRRKSITTTAVNPIPKDESRSLKRKEQNRAAQRAFRERKEKHVKELEEKVANLEARNDQAVHENDNLRELLSRLQDENMVLKHSSFNFTVPNSLPENGSVPTYSSHGEALGSSPSTVTQDTGSPPDSVKNINFFDWSSLTAFDPSVLNLLDDVTDGAGIGIGIDPSSDLVPHTSYKTIVSNPTIMSHASAFDTAFPLLATPDTQYQPPFDSNGATWPQPPQGQNTLLDNLFSSFISPSAPFVTPAHHFSDSPMNHHSTMSRLHSYSPLSSSSPESSNADSLLERRENSSDSDNSPGGHLDGLNSVKCPRTREEMAQRIEKEGLSPFASDPSKVRKGKTPDGPVIMCEGSNALPRTQPSDKNLEVLSAFRRVASDPKYKDVEMDRLCSEFASKALCDGTKVVLEPQSVDCILKSLSTTSH